MYKTGLFSGLKMELNFQRRSIYYLIQIYVPSAMIVVLSWISFWIDNQSIPARTALGITTVLAMTTLLFGVQSSLPSVPYIKAVDLFMIVSFAAVFVALVEFAVVNYTSMREKEQKESRATKNKYTVVSRYLPFTSMKYYGMMDKSATKRIYPLGGTHGAMRFHPTKV